MFKFYTEKISTLKTSVLQVLKEALELLTEMLIVSHFSPAKIISRYLSKEEGLSKAYEALPLNERPKEPSSVRAVISLIQELAATRLPDEAMRRYEKETGVFKSKGEPILKREIIEIMINSILKSSKVPQSFKTEVVKALPTINLEIKRLLRGDVAPLPPFPITKNEEARLAKIMTNVLQWPVHLQQVP